MTGSATITIRRQVLDVELRGIESDGLDLQRRLPDVCTRVLAPVLESALGGADPGDAHLYVERLAIELDEVSLQGLEHQLADAVRRGITDWLRRNVAVSGVGIAADGNVQRRSVAETVDDALVVFLRTGCLPWGFQVPVGARLEDIVLDRWGIAEDPSVSRGPPPAVAGRLREVLTEPNARTRLSLQFSPEFVTGLLRHIAPASAMTVEECLVALGSSNVPSPARTTFTGRLWEHVLVASAAGQRLAAAELVAAAWRSLVAADRHPNLATAIERHWPGATAPDSRADTATVASARAEPTVQRSPEASPPEVDTVEALAVDNAGLVLLHPFLAQYLTGLGVAADDELTDPGRALSLLHHLATGELTAPEYELTLAKALCGVPVDTPVAADAPLTETDLEEATALLNAAIGHWVALRNTSPDALRHEFLTRPGTLSLDGEGDWLLRVETRTSDILLDHLPWGVSMFRLTWMRRMMRVEWR